MAIYSNPSIVFSNITSSRYEQLGLKFVLYSAEVIFNKGLSQIYLGRLQEGMTILQEAKAAKSTVEHDVIDEAIEHQGAQYTVFSIVSAYYGNRMEPGRFDTLFSSLLVCFIDLPKTNCETRKRRISWAKPYVFPS